MELRIRQESRPGDRTVAERLAAMATGHFTYVPTGYAIRDAGMVWHEMTATRRADGKHWIYYLRRECGSYAGSFLA